MREPFHTFVSKGGAVGATVYRTSKTVGRDKSGKVVVKAKP